MASTLSRLAVRLMAPRPMSTLGVPPMRSSVKKAKPLTLSFSLALRPGPTPRLAWTGARSRSGGNRRLRDRPCRPTRHHSVPCSPWFRPRSAYTQPRLGRISDVSSPAPAREIRNLESQESRETSGPRVLDQCDGRRSDEDRAGAEPRSSATSPLPASTEKLGGSRRTWRSSRWRNTGESPGCSENNDLSVSMSRGCRALADSRTRTGAALDVGVLDHVDLVGDELGQVVAAVHSGCAW